MSMYITLPKEVQMIIGALQTRGHEAFAVGGCVRDCLLGRTPSDWDITTSARPEEIKAAFPHTIDTGIEHGTVTVRMKQKSFEVTTYRIDGAYEDARHPSGVTFTRSLEEDLRRRDFTVNAIAYNEAAGLIDLFGGREDLKRGMIRCVGDPTERFQEDALRMLRAVRFSGQLGFEMEEATEQAISKHAKRLEMVSVERICMEMVKLLCSPHPQQVRKIYELRLSPIFFPEWDVMMETQQHTRHHIASVGEHTIRVLCHVPPEKELRIAALLHDVAKPICKKTDAKGVDHFKGHPQAGSIMAERILKRWRMDHHTIAAVKALVRFHDERPPLTKRSVRRCINRMGDSVFPQMFALRRADVMGQSEFMREEKLAEIDRFEQLHAEIMENRECVRISDLAIGGAQIMEMGVGAGPEIGALLQYLLEWVLEDPKRNDPELLCMKAAGWIKKRTEDTN